MTPTVSLSLSLILIAAFFVLFWLFSLSFRAKLQIDAEHTANIYAINILPADSERITQSMTGIEIYSILQARVTEINHRSLALHLGTPEPSREFTREFNITTTPLANPILEWKKEIGRDEVSVDDEFAKRLGVKPGDRITFLLSGREVTLTVSGIRESIRDGFRPFFYFSFSETAFKNAPKTYFAATYSPDIEAWKQQILSLSWPHVTFIDVENILKIVREISSKILSVIALFFVAISVFGIFSVYSLFAELRPVEDMKRRLYPLFWASWKNTKKSMHTARIGILGSSFVLSQIIGIGIYTIVIRSSSFLTLSLPHIGIMLLITCIGYIWLYVLIRPRDSLP
jgi:putative ABC transport system permease protein